MRNPLRPLHIFFFGMVFGAGSLYSLTDVRWPKSSVAVPAPQIAVILPAPVIAPPVLPEAAPPVPAAPLPQEPNTAPTTLDSYDANNGGIPTNTIPAEQLPQHQQSALTNLLIPVRGIGVAQLSDTFSQARSDGRVHEAIDISSPTGTPVLAVADGRIVKLFDSKPGGLTLYQFDASETYAYYYAHLDAYAAGIVEGKQLRRGELLGYVGSTGNANPAAPHLHFAIFELGPEKNWWQGRAINPYPLMAGD